MRFALAVLFASFSTALGDSASISLKGQYVNVIETDSLGFPIINAINRDCSGIGGGYSSLVCAPLPCQAAGATCGVGTFTPGCTGTCGNKCPPAGQSCNATKPNCASPSCFTCGADYQLTASSTKYTYDCFEMGVTNVNGTKYTWAVACGTVENQQVCQAWRTGDSLVPTVAGLISVMYPCQSIVNGECATGSSGRDLKKTKTKVTTTPTSAPTKAPKTKTTKTKPTKTKPTKTKTTETKTKAPSPTPAPKPSDAPSSSPTACPFDCSSPAMCKAFDGINWFLGDNFLNKNMFPTPTQGVVYIEPPKLVIGNAIVKKWSDLVSWTSLCKLEPAVATCAKNAKSNSVFAACVTKALTTLEDERLIRSQDAKVILKAVAASNIGVAGTPTMAPIGGRNLRAEILNVA